MLGRRHTRSVFLSFSVRVRFFLVTLPIDTTEIKKPLSPNCTGTVNTIHVQSVCAIGLKDVIFISADVSRQGQQGKNRHEPKTKRKRIQCIYTVTVYYDIYF